MEVTERYGNIIIMCSDIYMDDFWIDYTNDFYVGSYADKEETLDMLQKANLVLKAGVYSLPSTSLERILLDISLLNNGILKFTFDSPVCQKSTIHILSRIIHLLKENDTSLNFFCPES